jgi:hypothetical protein
MTAVRRVTARTVLLGALLVLVSGCRIGLTTDVTFEAQGGGTFAVAVRVDGATLREFAALGVDPGLDVALALDPARGWRVERTTDADGGLTLTHRRAFADAAELIMLLTELTEGLAAEDPTLRLDLGPVVSARGAVTLDGTVALSPPRTTGARLDGEPVGPSGDALAALTADSVRAVLVVSVPGTVVAHDADRVDGRRLEWDVPVGTPRPVMLRTDAPSALARMPVWGWPILTALGAGAALMLRRSLARRRRAPEDAATGAVDPAGPVGPADGGFSPAE